jgi:hypothetical protein
LSYGKKISDEQFLSALRENAGLFAQTAAAIQKQYGVAYTRQAVRQKAELSFKDELLDIYEENLDCAEEGLRSLMNSTTESVKLRALELYLKTKGKMRGYTEKTELNITGTINIEPKKWADADNAE